MMPRLVIIGSLVLAALWLVAEDFAVDPRALEDRMLLAELNREEGLVFRQHNAREHGVVVLANGMQVKVLHHGAGRIPASDEWVSVHYQGWHVDGRLFDSTHRLGLPGIVPIEQTIPGWQQLLTSVPEGTRARIVLPAELAYGQAGSGRIGPDETLIFEIELLGIVPPTSLSDPRPLEPLQQPVPGLVMAANPGSAGSRK